MADPPLVVSLREYFGRYAKNEFRLLIALLFLISAENSSNFPWFYERLQENSAWRQHTQIVRIEGGKPPPLKCRQKKHTVRKNIIWDLPRCWYFNINATKGVKWQHVRPLHITSVRLFITSSNPYLIQTQQHLDQWCTLVCHGSQGSNPCGSN